MHGPTIYYYAPTLYSKGFNGSLYLSVSYLLKSSISYSVLLFIVRTYFWRVKHLNLSLFVTQLKSISCNNSSRLPLCLVDGSLDDLWGLSTWFSSLLICKIASAFLLARAIISLARIFESSLTYLFLNLQYSELSFYVSWSEI